MPAPPNPTHGACDHIQNVNTEFGQVRLELSAERHFRVRGGNRSGQSVRVRSVESRAAFHALLDERDWRIESLDAATAVDSMLDFYFTVRADDVDLTDGGDMLLFQWGTDDWGDGPSFEYDITRQFITKVSEPADADNAFWQLSLVLHFEPNAETAQTGSGNRWCDGLGEVGQLREFIDRHPASAVARRLTPIHVDLRFGAAG
jgi:hypothetical protein